MLRYTAAPYWISGLLLCSVTQAAYYVDLATPENDAHLTFSIVDTVHSWSVTSVPFTLEDGDFAAADLQLTTGLWLMLGLDDKESAVAMGNIVNTPDFTYQQLSISFFRFNGGPEATTFAANTLTLTIENIFSAESAEITGFEFGAQDAETNNADWSVSYNPATGTLTFTNIRDISITTDSPSYWMQGSFTVIPEPAGAGIWTAIVACGFSGLRRRRR